MTATQHVTIGPEFFLKSRNDYADWHWAVVREFFQNCIDCGSKHTELTATEQGGKTTVVVKNDGAPMTEDILVDKLLSLGSSGKNFEGAVGGFGKAKELLYFCHESYEIRSGDLVVRGAGAAYTLDRGEFVRGTISTIVIDGDHADRIEREAKRFVGLAQVQTRFTINHVEHTRPLHKGTFRKALDFGRVYTNKSSENQVVVRIGGIPMFTRYARCNRCVVLELDGTSGEVMTSNRDNLRWEQARILDNFITDLSVNKRKALSSKAPVYQRFAGPKLGYVETVAKDRVKAARDNLARVIKALVAQPADKPIPVEAAPVSQPSATETVAIEDVIRAAVSGRAPVPVTGADQPGADQPSVAAYAPSGTDDTEKTSAPTVAQQVDDIFGAEFIVKNETGRKLPAAYRPDSNGFTNYNRRLAQIWGRLIVQMHRLFGHEDTFAIGFFFPGEDDEGVVAQHEEGQYGRVYYINPAERKDGKLRNHWKWSQTRGRIDLILAALHEFIHGKGYENHDERYAAALTRMAGDVMIASHKGHFKWCFQK